MSRHHKRRMAIKEVQKPDTSSEAGIVGSFSARIGVPIRNTDELMNWIVWGNTQGTFHDYTNKPNV